MASSYSALRDLSDASTSSHAAGRPIIAVCGGVRGLQGSSVVRFLVRDGIFTPRALTRDIECPKALELTRQGVQVVYADFDKPETLRYAFEGAYGVFGMTNYFEHKDTEREIRQGCNIVEAAKEAQISHFVWSSFEPSATGDIESVDSKARIQKHLEASGIPHTNMFFGFYLENMVSFGMKKLPDDSWDLIWPYPTDLPLAVVSPSDTGGWVTGAFLDPEEWIGRSLHACSDQITLRQFARVFGEIGNCAVHVHERTLEDVRTRKDEYEESAWKLMMWIVSIMDRPLAPMLDLSRKLHGDMKDVRTWVSEYWKKPATFPAITYNIHWETTSEPMSDVTVNA